MDFIVERGPELFAIEVKASRAIRPQDLGGLKSFAGYVGKKHRPLVFYLGEVSKKIEGIDILPWQEGLRAIGL